MATEVLYPDGTVFIDTNLTCAYTDVDDDADSSGSDSDYCDADDTTNSTTLRASFGPISGSSLTEGTDVQNFRVRLACTNNQGNVTVSLYEDGVSIASLGTVQPAVGTFAMYEFTWDAADLTDGTGADVEIYISGGQGGGAPGGRYAWEVSAIEWNVDYSTDTSVEVLPSVGVVNVVSSIPALPKTGDCYVDNFNYGEAGNQLPTVNPDWQDGFEIAIRLDGEGRVYTTALSPNRGDAVLDPDRQPFNNDHGVETIRHTAVAATEIYLRHDFDSTAAYRVIFDTQDDEISVYRYESGSGTTMATVAQVQDNSSTATLYAQILGDVITVKYNGTEVTSFADPSPIVSGYAGFAIEGQGSFIDRVIACDVYSTEFTTEPTNGVINITGYAPTVAGGTTNEVTPANGVITTTGYAPTVTKVTTARPTTGALNEVGYAPSVTYELELTTTPTVGVLNTVGNAPTVTYQQEQTLLPSNGVLTTTGYAPTVTAFNEITVTSVTGNNNITGYAPSVELDVNLTPAIGVVTTTGYAPTVDVEAEAFNVAPTTGVINITGESPTLSVTHDLTVTNGLLSTTGYAPTVSASAIKTVAPSNGVLTITGETPSLDVIKELVATHGLIVITGNAPSVTIPDAQTVSPSVGNLTVVGKTPSVELTHDLTPANNVINISGYIPVIDTGQQYTPAIGGLNITGLAPVVDLRWWVPDTQTPVTWAEGSAAVAVWTAASLNSSTWSVLSASTSIWTEVPDTSSSWTTE